MRFISFILICQGEKNILVVENLNKISRVNPFLGRGFLCTSLLGRIKPKMVSHYFSSLCELASITFGHDFHFWGLQGLECIIFLGTLYAKNHDFKKSSYQKMSVISVIKVIRNFINMRWQFPHFHKSQKWYF